MCCLTYFPFIISIEMPIGESSKNTQYCEIVAGSISRSEAVTGNVCQILLTYSKTLMLHFDMNEFFNVGLTPTCLGI